MALPTPTLRFSLEDLAMFCGEAICLVKSSSNQPGFNRYRLLDLDKDWEIVGSSHKMTGVSVLYARRLQLRTQNNLVGPTSRRNLRKTLTIWHEKKQRGVLTKRQHGLCGFHGSVVSLLSRVLVYGRRNDVVDIYMRLPSHGWRHSD